MTTSNLKGCSTRTLRDLIINTDDTKPVPHSFQGRAVTGFPQFSKSDNCEPDWPLMFRHEAGLMEKNLAYSLIHAESIIINFSNP
jgi:hypothetical protein